MVAPLSRRLLSVVFSLKGLWLEGFQPTIQWNIFREKLWKYAKALFEPLGFSYLYFQTIQKYKILKTEPMGYVNHGSTFSGQVRAFFHHIKAIFGLLLFSGYFQLSVSGERHVSIMNNVLMMSNIAKACTKVNKN